MQELIAQTGKFLSENLLAVIGLIIAAVTAIGVFYGPRLVAKRHEKKGKLLTHFDGMKQKIIYPILQVISGVVNNCGTLEASTLRGSRTMDDDPFPLLFGFEELDEYQAFQTHYPDTDAKWRALITNIWKHNQDVERAIKELEDIIKNNTNLPPIKQYHPPNEEKIMPEIIILIYQSIYCIAEGQRPQYDFSKIEVNDTGNLQRISLVDKTVAIIHKEEIEGFKSALLEIQNSQRLRDRAVGLEGSAFQLMKRLEAIAHELQSISDYGLISKTAGYKFTPNKTCVICKRIFFL